MPEGFFSPEIRSSWRINTKFAIIGQSDATQAAASASRTRVKGPHPTLVCFRRRETLPEAGLYAILFPNL